MLLLPILIALGVILAIRLLKTPNLSIPGPFIGRFTNLWYLWQMKRGDFHKTNIQLHERNGPVVRIAPNYFSLSDPAAAKAIYGHGSKYAKSEWYDAWTFSPDPKITNLFSERNGQRHAGMRRKVAAMYSMTSLVAYEPFVDNCVGIFKERLEEFASEGTVIDVAHWVQCYAFDVIGEITFGKRFGFLDRGEDIRDVMAFLDLSFTVSSYSGLYIWLRPYFLRLAKAMGKNQTYVNQFTYKHVMEAKKAHQENKEKQSASNLPEFMVMKLIELQDKQSNDAAAMMDWDVMSTAGANVGAGSDTTAISLSSVLYYMYKTPGCLEKVRKEIEESRMPEKPTFKDAQAMVYLQAVIKEALRIHPGVGFPLFRTVPQGGAMLSGRYFPEGTNVGVNSWVVQYDTEVYGPDAAIFRPERWLESDKERLTAMEQNFMPFGMGSRTCIGKNISLLEMSKLIPVLVRDFDMEFSDDIKASIGVKNRWFVKPTNFQARMIKRTV
ncbi:hypothetical protein ASPWEDRAFT_176383 [Aspergillus wentii DTO 134E9]|uniref:Cytochrome P450 n=1 Tax=Aspergillus wentii DTO 134E9 TaxID=1073089 RepID=A0A1L9R8V8_ASPWE|nr:uncharacterized protein ASPWEDRAFT_176383 [Aspergillus wentii DTO 134E9]KAI9925112.1 hypothetical protein MW887_006520 [Aspergillus wentii]OJJ31297.1 hypothetical protein ASPWEDRAFT_176383 [Aspergillus wentii DTO 134E9]